jgi:hypothetical protein
MNLRHLKIFTLSFLSILLVISNASEFLIKDLNRNKKNKKHG